MTSPRKQTDPVIIFLVLVFAMGWGFRWLAVSGLGEIWLSFATWTPTIAVIALGKRGAEILAPLSRINWRWCLLGIVLGVAPMALAQLSLAIFKSGVLNTELVQPTEEGLVPHFFLFLGKSPQPAPYFAANTLLTLFITGILSTAFGPIAAEIGWRGFLQQRLTNRFGFAHGTLFTSVAWVAWLLPNSLTAAIGALASGFTLGALRERSQAIWPCGLLFGFTIAVSEFHLVTGPWLQEAVMIWTIIVAALTILMLRHTPVSREALSEEKEKAAADLTGPTPAPR